MIEDTLKERGNNYGNFHTLANLTQTLQTIIMQHYMSVHGTKENPAPQMPHFMAESIHMICHKLSRIANGNPMHADSWHDIGGYAELVVDIIKKAEEQQQKAIAEAAAEAASAEQKQSEDKE